MLKIKDEVDLEVLENMGLIKYEYEPYYTGIGKVKTVEYHYKDITIYGDWVAFESEHIFPRRIKLSGFRLDTIDRLYDLIQEGLVEKVDEQPCKD